MILKESNNSFRIVRILVSIAAIVIIIAGINLAQSIVVLFLVSVFLASLGIPPILWLKEKHIPSGFAVFFVMTGMIFIIILIGAQIATSFSSFLTELPSLQSRIREQVSDLTAIISSKDFVIKEKYFLDYINPESIMKLTANLLSGFSSVLSDLVLILLTVTFILLEVSSFPIKLRKILGDPKQKFPQFTKFAVDMRRYMVIKTLISLATGIIIAFWLYILGVDYPILWGFLAFLFNYIPNIGSMIAAIPALVLAFIQLGIGSTLMVAVGYTAINFLIGNIIEPRLMAEDLDFPH